MKRQPGDVDAVRRVLGVILLFVAPTNAFLQRANAVDTIATLETLRRLIPAPVTNSDSATLSSAAYHAAHATATMNGRWGPAGFMTLSALAFALGCVLTAWPLLRRKPQ